MCSAMDMAPTTASITTTNTKSPDPETQTLTRIQPPRLLTSTNGSLKRLDSHHHRFPRLSAPEPVVITYKECLKNHAATLGGHAVDGCGEFMPSPTATHTDPTSLKCAACGCHRNFHRREPEDSPHRRHPTTTTTTIEYQPHHRHHPPPPALAQQLLQPYRSPSSASPPPISSSFPPAPHMLLSLSGGGVSAGGSSSSRKRFRTKFSQNQKERMLEFAEKLGWKMQKRDEDLFREFCNEVGVTRGALKVWMHNNKNTFCKRESTTGNGAERNNLDQIMTENFHQRSKFENHDNAAGINGSSSSF